MHKIDDGIEKKISELSSGEKRQALINIVYAFLKRESEREKYVVIGIDEPENSLHTSLCYDQFERLKEISKNNQVLITTHWYGFLPIISEGYSHFLCQEKSKISFSTYDLYEYRPQVNRNIRERIPINFYLKSTNDLVQAIYYSIIKEHPYNWIICEGISEKIYFEYFFKKEILDNKLRILPMGGQSKVINIFKYLEVPINNELKDKNYGKIYCIIDTDNERCSFVPANVNSNVLFLKRLSNKNNNEKTELLNIDHSDSCTTDIEQSLNPVVFKACIELLSNFYKENQIEISNNTGNTSFIRNFNNYKLEEYFNQNEGENKILFSKEYVNLMENDFNDTQYIPNWIEEIRNKIFRD